MLSASMLLPEGVEACRMVTGGVQGPEQREAASPSSSCWCPHWLFPAASLLPSPWLLCLAVARAEAIVVILDFENVASFTSWCFRPCKLHVVGGKTCLGSNCYAQFPASPICYFHLLFNTVEFVGPRHVSAYTWCYLIRSFKDGIRFTPLEVLASELGIWAPSITE